MSAALGALFVAADAALGSLTGPRIAALLEHEDQPHRSTLARYKRARGYFHATYVVGRTFCAAITAVLVVKAVEQWLPGWLGIAVAILVSISVYAPLSDVATAVARRRAETLGLGLATWLRPFEVVLWPIASPLSRISGAFADRMESPEPQPAEVAAAEVEHLVAEVARKGGVGAEPAEMIRNVLEFEDLRARDVMVARAKVEAIALDTPLDVVRRKVADSGHSRYPVFDGQLDNVIGLLVAKDVFKTEAPCKGDTTGPTLLSEVVRRDVIFVHEAQKLVSLLRDMRLKRQHLAVVVDEFGGTRGIVTLEDVIEEIVGDIRDEHDEVAEPPPPIQELAEGHLVAVGSLPLADLLAFLGTPPMDDEPATTTLASAFEPPVEVGATVLRWGFELVVREEKRGVAERIEVLSRPTAPSTMRPPRSLATPSSRGSHGTSDESPAPPSSGSRAHGKAADADDEPRSSSRAS
ncbi:MAG: hemolysin family protein [Polyangiaceae bacterium]